MAEMFSTLGTWNWLIFGFILMALELAAPGVFLFWLGLAALVVGLLSFVFTPSWQAQLLMFADDTVWGVAGPDAPAGSRVKVVRADGASLTVAAV